MNKKQFLQWLDPRLQNAISSIGTLSFNKSPIIYGVLKPSFVPKEFKDTWLTSSLLEIVAPSITKVNILISRPEHPDYQWLERYIVLEEYFKSLITRPERNTKGINQIFMNTIETELIDAILQWDYKKDQKKLIQKNLIKFNSELLSHENILQDWRRSIRKNLIHMLNKKN